MFKPRLFNNWKYELPECETYYTRVKFPSPKPFSNRWMCLIPGALRLNRFYAWDGATCAPDFEWVLKPSLYHDAIYQFAEDIARTWGCSVWTVLRFADRVFFEAMTDAPPIMRCIYYGAVATIGYPFHQVMRLVKFKRIKL